MTCVFLTGPEPAMGRVPFLLLLLLVVPHALASLLCATASAADPADVEFIRSSCRSTSYPAVCLQSLAGYASAVHRSRRLLARAALDVAISRAQSASIFLGAPPPVLPVAVLQECIFFVDVSETQLRRSREELAQMPRRGSPGFASHISNVRTWVSAAATGARLCLDEISRARVDPGLGAAVRGRISVLEQETGNALDLITGID